MEEHPLQLFTVEQVSDMLGVKPYWIKRQVREGKISHVKLGSKKLVRFRHEDVAEFIKAREESDVV